MIDLHTHSYYSDGSDSPAQLVRQAEALGLTAIALCDHNTVAGLPEFMAAGENSTVETVPGAELTAEYNGTELHILALLIPAQQYGTVTARLERFRREKEKSNQRLIRALARAGLVIDYGAICEASGDYVNRADIALALTRTGYTRSVEEAFQKYLAPGQGFYTPPKRPDALETVRFIRAIGAAAVLAHPFLNLTEDRLRRFLPEAVESGLTAMETYYAEYDLQTTRLALGISEEYGLLPSGGSDYHGAAKPDIRLGVGRGELEVPDSVFWGLKTQ